MTAQCQTESKLHREFSCFVNKRGSSGKLIDNFIRPLCMSVLYDLSLCSTTFICATDHTWMGVYIVATQLPVMTLDFTWLNGESFLGDKQTCTHLRRWGTEVFQKLQMGRSSRHTVLALRLRETVLAVRMQLLQVLSKLVKISGH